MLSDLEIEAARLRQILRTCLEARLVLCELRKANLNTLIESPNQPPEQKAGAIAERNQVTLEWGRVMTELRDLDDLEISLLKPAD
jgi:hypothetical protein